MANRFRTVGDRLKEANDLGNPFGLRCRERIDRGGVQYIFYRRGIWVASTRDPRKLKSIMLELMP